MNTFVEQIRLAEIAAENIYFARLDHELIESLHKWMQEQEDSFRPCVPPPKAPENVPEGVTNE
jgi:hypothetical protein